MPTKKNVIRWLSLCSLALVATVGWADQETRTVSIGAGSLTFRPPHTRGDKEFKGHGPNIKADFVVSVSEDRKKIMAKIYMKAEEWDSDEDDRPQSDYTTAEGRKDDFELHTVSGEGWQIVSFDRPGVFGQTWEVAESYGYIDDDEEVDSFPGNRAVVTWNFTGDTHGDDAGVKTGVRLDYPAFRVIERRAPGLHPGDRGPGWYGFQNSSNIDREDELHSRCASSFTRVHVADGTTFNDLCASIGLRCVQVCDWSGKTKSCADSPYSWGDGSRIGYCQ